MWSRARGALRWWRAASIIGGLFAAASCTDTPPVTPKSPIAPGHARLSIRPSFARQAAGTPLVVLSTIRGVLIGPAGDSIVVEARFEGDSAILVFDVPVTGGAANYTLDLTGFDANHQEAYHGTQQYTLRPGDNSVPSPEWTYSAPDSKLATVHVAPGSATLNSGATASFSVNGTDAANQPISPILVAWSVKDAGIATVDANGQVRAGDVQGSTYVIARTVTNLADSALIRVHAPVSRVAVAPATLELIRGKSGAAAAELRDATNHLIDDRTATWSSSDPSVATVSSSGAIQAIKNGTATITASAEGKSGSVAVTVVTPIDHITVTPGSLTFASLGETQNVTITVVPKTGASVDGISPTIASSNTAVATIDATGKVTARTNGTSTISAAAEGVTGSANVTVQQVATSITVSPSSQGVAALGDSRHFSASAVDALGNAVVLPIAWTSSDATIATVDGDGNATGRARGQVTITATSGTKSATAAFTVSQIIAEIGIAASPTTIQVGNSSSLTTRAFDANGSPIPGVTATFVSQNPSVVSVNGTRATAVAPGNATIVGTVGNFTASASIHVDPVGGPVAGNVATGTVINGQTGLGIPGATVSSGSLNATTASDGTFSLAGVPNGTNLTIAASGFVSTTYFNVQGTNNSAALGALPLAPTSSQTGSFSGRIVDAVTGLNIPNATLTARAGINNTSGTILQQTSSDQSGNYSGSLAAGTYTILATASGYANATGTVPSIGGLSISNQNIVMSPAGLSGTQFRFILQWDANPRDLDSHLVGPAGNGQTFEIAYYSRTFSPNGNTIAQLDQDVTSGFGPETITLNQTIPGHYRYYVHIFCCGSSFGGARLTVMRGSQVAGQFTAPTTTGSVWTVLELDGTTGGITSINTVSPSYNIPGAGSPSFNLIPGSGGQQNDVTALLERVKAHPKPAASSRPRRPDPDTY